MFLHRSKKLLVRSTSVGSYQIIFPQVNGVDPDHAAYKSSLIWVFSVCKGVKGVSMSLRVNLSCTLFHSTNYVNINSLHNGYFLCDFNLAVFFSKSTFSKASLKNEDPDLLPTLRINVSHHELMFHS